MAGGRSAVSARVMFMRFCPNLLVDTAIVNEDEINRGPLTHKSDDRGGRFQDI